MIVYYIYTRKKEIASEFLIQQNILNNKTNGNAWTKMMEPLT